MIRGSMDGVSCTHINDLWQSRGIDISKMTTASCYRTFWKSTLAISARFWPLEAMGWLGCSASNCVNPCCNTRLALQNGWCTLILPSTNDRMYYFVSTPTATKRITPIAGVGWAEGSEFRCQIDYWWKCTWLRHLIPSAPQLSPLAIRRSIGW
jgi:hypothetical protein